MKHLFFCCSFLFLFSNCFLPLHTTTITFKQFFSIATLEGCSGSFRVDVARQGKHKDLPWGLVFHEKSRDVGLLEVAGMIAGGISYNFIWECPIKVVLKVLLNKNRPDGDTIQKK